MDTIKYILPEDRIPKNWYNIQADLPEPCPPVRHPGTGQPIGPDDLAPLFPMGLIMQEVSQEREIEIPNEVREVYQQWRPSPLFRARRLEKALDTPARTNLTPRLPRLFTTKLRASSEFPPKPAPGNGDRPCRWHAPFLAWSARCSWSG